MQFRIGKKAATYKCAGHRSRNQEKWAGEAIQNVW